MKTEEVLAVLRLCEVRLIKKSVPPKSKERVGIAAVIAQLEGDIAIENAEPPKHYAVRADICSDDENVSGTVDAEDWLKLQSDDDIAYMCNDTGANETTDGLFWWHDSGSGAPWSQQVARRVGRYTGSIDDVGFKVRFNEDDLHVWVQKNAPKAWKIYEKEY